MWVMVEGGAILSLHWWWWEPAFLASTLVEVGASLLSLHAGGGGSQPSPASMLRISVLLYILFFSQPAHASEDMHRLILTVMRQFVLLWKCYLFRFLHKRFVITCSKVVQHEVWMHRVWCLIVIEKSEMCYRVFFIISRGAVYVIFLVTLDIFINNTMLSPPRSTYHKTH